MNFSLRSTVCLIALAAATVLFAKPPAEPPANPPPVENPPKNAGEVLTKPGKLPWEKPESSPLVLPAKRIDSARSMLHAYGIDDSQLANFFHHVPLGPGEEETLYRILFRMPSFGLANLARWQEKEVSWSAVEADPDAHRAKLLPVSGRVKRVARKEVLSEVAVSLEYNHYFQVTLQLDDAPNPVLVCARRVPKAWSLDEPLDEPASCAGLFLKLGEKIDDHSQFVFAATRMEWHPERADATLGVTDDLVWLASKGFDVGLFDTPRERNQRPIGDTEAECFYAILSTLQGLDPAELKQHARQALDIGPLLQDPKSHHGDARLVRGNARRVQKIILGEGDRDFRERFGVEHYYQVDVFIPLGEKEIRLSKGPQDKDGPIFDQSFLITVCTLKVPPELEEGKIFDLHVRLPVVFYKNWEFPSKYTQTFGKGDWKSQPAPMLVGLEPEIVPFEKSSASDPFFIGLGIVGIVVLVATVLGLWLVSRGDKQFQQRTREILNPSTVGPPK